MADAPAAAPGVRTRPARFVPRLHWELLVCGIAGHELVGPRRRARCAPRTRWSCARSTARAGTAACAATAGCALPPPPAPAREHPPDRDEIELPLRGRPLRDKIVLRLIAINRAVHFFVLGLLGLAILLFASHRATFRDRFYRVVTDLQGGVVAGGGHAHHGLLGEIDKLFTLQSSQAAPVRRRRSWPTPRSRASRPSACGTSAAGPST